MTSAQALKSSDLGCPSGLAPSETDNQTQTIDPSLFVQDHKDHFSLDLLVRGAKCGGCISKIENAVLSIEGLKTARLNLTTGKLHAEWIDRKAEPGKILKAVEDLGYAVSPFNPQKAKSEHSKEEKQLLMALAVAGFAAANVMLLSVSVWSGAGEMSYETKTFLHWISAAIAMPVVAFSGRPFFKSALNALKSKHVNMDVPISLAVCLAIGMSLHETVSGGEHTYFDAAVMLLFFLLIGRFLDAKLQREAHTAARDLSAMQEVATTLISENGHAKSILSTSLVPGDIIHVAAGERLAVDIEVIDGQSDIDTKLVTGETRLSSCAIGSQIFAGSINITSPLRAKVLSNTENSMLSEVSKLLDIGEQKKSTYRQIADKAAELYVPLVHTVAASAFLGWYLWNGDIKNAIFIAIAVLIITCPCALALAAPVVQVVAVGRLFKRHVFLKSGDALERLAACTHIVFDKTGTLTNPEIQLIETPENQQYLRQAALLARGSRHPYSRALVKAVGGGQIADNMEEIPGCGVQGLIDGSLAKLGKAEWVLTTPPNRLEHTSSSICFQIDGQEAVFFDFEEVLVDGALQTVSQLKTAHFRTIILSGDENSRVQQIASHLKVDEALGELTPVDKANYIESLHDKGAKVLMVGDGLNDAGALANAHASLAPGGAVDVSRAASDGVYANDDLMAILDVLEISRQSKRRMLENFSFAALYNAVAIPFAVAGFITPLIAAIAMSGSSLVVTLNALRLNIRKRSGTPS